jgi:DNA-binding NtrC family response regulator
VGLTPEAVNCLVEYGWPGNIRELENAIERAVVLGTGEEIGPEDLPDQIATGGGDGKANKVGYHAEMESYKLRLIQNALEQAGGNRAKAAADLGPQRTYLYRLIRQLGL